LGLLSICWLFFNPVDVKGRRRLDPEANRRLESRWNKWFYLGRGELGHQEAGNGFRVRVGGEAGSGFVIRVGVGAESGPIINEQP